MTVLDEKIIVADLPAWNHEAGCECMLDGRERCAVPASWRLFFSRSCNPACRGSAERSALVCHLHKDHYAVHYLLSCLICRSLVTITRIEPA